jgi:hypothetical protein
MDSINEWIQKTTWGKRQAQDRQLRALENIFILLPLFFGGC